MAQYHISMGMQVKSAVFSPRINTDGHRFGKTRGQDERDMRRWPQEGAKRHIDLKWLVASGWWTAFNGISAGLAATRLWGNQTVAGWRESRDGGWRKEKTS
jgi:hypothetical protein